MTKSAEDQPIGSSQEADGDKEARRKILIGEAVLAKVQRGDWSQGQLNELLHSELKTDQDRALFDLQPPMRPSQLLETHRAAIRQIVESHKGLNPRVFGSVLHGTDTEKSDLDLLIDTENLTYFDLARMHEKLSGLLGIDVDLVTSGGLPKQWKEKVLAEARSI